MSLNIRGNTDYSVLFSSLSTKQNSSSVFFGSTGRMSDLTTSVLGGNRNSGGINLGDYASIKNGSYKKLLKSYFNMKAEQEKDNVDATDKTQKEESKDGKKTDLIQNGKVLTSAWEDIVASANAKTDALYTELGLKTGTVSEGSYLDKSV